MAWLLNPGRIVNVTYSLQVSRTVSPLSPFAQRIPVTWRLR